MPEQREIMTCCGCLAVTRRWEWRRVRLVYRRYRLPVCDRCAGDANPCIARPLPTLKEMRRHA